MRSTYPPLPPYVFSFAYIAGFQSSKIMMAGYLLSFYVLFYAVLREYVSHLGSVFFSFLLIITPELSAFFTLSSTNAICTVYVSLGFIFVYLWYDIKKQGFFALGTLFLMMSLWTRSESIVFVGAAGIIILLRSVKEKRIKELLAYATLMGTVFFLWQWYLTDVLNISQEKWIITRLYWDSDKLSHLLTKVSDVTFNTQFYGLVVYIFLIVVLLNLANIYKSKDRVVLLGIILLAYLSYLFVYYQIDTDYSLDKTGWISAGYRRGFFYFIPLLLFYSAINKYSMLLFNRFLKMN